MHLDEEFLYFIWRKRLVSQLSLVTSTGEPLYIIDPGIRNNNAGPDFSLAKIRIAEQLWAGNVEIHVRSSDWLIHGHYKDVAYDSVILHVVYDHDKDIYRTDGSPVPVLILKDRIPADLLNRYGNFHEQRNHFPCYQQIGMADPQVAHDMLDKAAQRRLINRSEKLEPRLVCNNYDWSSIMYLLLIRSFGFSVNKVPFELLADNLDFLILQRHRDNPLQTEALLFGQAGFLEAELKDNYPKQLKREYRFLKLKYGLTPGERSVWKFMRMHPQNFPALRIAQVAGIMASHANLMSDVLLADTLVKLRALLSGFKVHPYWQNHSNFDRSCKKLPLKLGKRSVDNLIVNAICLLLYSYGHYYHLPLFRQRAIKLMKNIPPEKNSIVNTYKQGGLSCLNAFESQGLLELHNTWCLNKKCLNCDIGKNIIGR